MVLDGQSLTVAGVVAVARYGSSVALNGAPEIRERMAKSRSVLVDKVQTNKSVYGVSTGLGGSGAHSFKNFTIRLPFCGRLTSRHMPLHSTRDSDANTEPAADTRTNNTIGLGLALVQHHHTGVLPSSESRRDQGVLPPLPLSDPLAATSMPEAWVRGAIVVRINSLIRGHSAVRWELLEKMVLLLRENITPCVPLRGSISASGGMFRP